MKFIEKSKQQVINKLKYISSIMDLVASILKSFATIIGSIVATATAGVTGYYEVKKVVIYNRKEVKTLSGGEAGSDSAGRGSGSGYTSQPSAPTPQQGTYTFDINSVAFIMSILFLGFLLLKKMRKPQETK